MTNRSSSPKKDIGESDAMPSGGMGVWVDGGGGKQNGIGDAKNNPAPGRGWGGGGVALYPTFDSLSSGGFWNVPSSAFLRPSYARGLEGGGGGWRMV